MFTIMSQTNCSYLTGENLLVEDILNMNSDLRSVHFRVVHLELQCQNITKEYHLAVISCTRNHIWGKKDLSSCIMITLHVNFYI